MDTALCGHTATHFPHPIHSSLSMTGVLPRINETFCDTAPTGQTRLTGQKGDWSHCDALMTASFI